MALGLIMKGVVAHALFLIVTPSWSIAAEANLRLQYKLDQETDRQVCESATAVLEAISSAELLNGSWRAKFDGVEWKKGSARTTAAGGREETVEFEYSLVDVDSDLSTDVAVRFTTLLRSQLEDSLYVLSPSTFDAAKGTENGWRTIASAPGIRAGQGLVFSDQTAANPHEMALWKNDGVTYVVLKEYFFGRKDARFASSFVVARIGERSSASPTSAADQKRPPTAVCRFSWRESPTSRSSRSRRQAVLRLNGGVSRLWNGKT